ncbi:Sec-independent protein translocase protein TatA [Caenibius tardaugens NBRC 16725]|uniref:Sec-independent protein translocase protein TatA n=1 Tax=Caenibius tardaugens NBRC 16725 TaxID=1219035 RepID=U2YLD2_9SPHN|nr:twin-arginine translocase TatA/TatE family subunit [Caenibius tardaugens]AZI36770.1 twin-arginine translocase TatA/TatE family subunit [Caenibius tardaugens NBRC 16725]GAD49445.1 Sec-independent protein translocase protein TatA [Caenibius tardaugens NBRC 16725]
MGLSVWHILVVALVILVLFGRGRISEMMGDFGKGIKSFKEGIKEEDDKPVAPRIEAPSSDAPPAEVRPADTTENKSADNQPTSN